MKVRALKQFNDYKEKVTRMPGDIFEVTATRFKQIVSGLKKFGPGDWVEEVKEEEPKKRGK